MKICQTELHLNNIINQSKNELNYIKIDFIYLKRYTVE
jgi:hypothetical protein